MESSSNMAATATAPAASSAAPTARHTPIDVNNGTNLIARAEALNAFMRMQPAANQARMNPTSASSPSHAAGRARSHTAMTSSQPSSPSSSAPAQNLCLCFGKASSTLSTAAGPGTGNGNNDSDHPLKPAREYYPDNLSVQPKPHPWEEQMEWLIIACIDLLERCGLHEHNLFAVSAVDDLVRQTTVPHKVAMPAHTDPHVAAGVIKAKIRHAAEPLVDRSCLRSFIEKASKQQQQQDQDAAQGGDHGGGGGGGGDDHHIGASTLAVASHSASTFAESYLAKTIETTDSLKGPRRAYILARLMRLLGRVSANVQTSRMNAHSLAKCVAPSMLHWDPNSGFALLMLGRITAYVMTMIEDARVFDENLCIKIDDLSTRGGW